MAVARLHAVHAIELFYTGLLALTFLLVTWFSVYVVYKLYKGQD